MRTKFELHLILELTTKNCVDLDESALWVLCNVGENWKKIELK